MESPFLSTLNLEASSPPSPVFDLPPILFIAIANVEWASVDIDPKDMAPVANLFTISLTGSTWSNGTGSFKVLNSNKPLKLLSFFDWSLTFEVYFLNVL